MSHERWGSLSVADHVDTRSLVANVLLYDRLVVPVMVHQPERNERAYWVSKGWDPDLQATRLEQLEELAIRRPWSVERREVFKTRAQELAAEQYDSAGMMDGQQLTRIILAQEDVLDRPAGVHEATVIAAYNSAKSLQNDYLVAHAGNDLAAHAYLLSRRLAVPDLPDPDDSFREAIKLSRDEEFRARRADLFQWQEDEIIRGRAPGAVVERLCEMSDAYNVEVQKAFKVVRWKLAFTVFGAALGLGTGIATGGVAAAAAPAALSLISFMLLDRKPAIDAGSSRPAAMFHDIETHLGLKLL